MRPGPNAQIAQIAQGDLGGATKSATDARNFAIAAAVRNIPLDPLTALRV